LAEAQEVPQSEGQPKGDKMHYLDPEIARLKGLANIKKEVDGAILANGQGGASRIVQRRVYFFEPGQNRFDEVIEFASARLALWAGLAWAVDGHF
jgi:hypothetical protein